MDDPREEATARNLSAVLPKDQDARGPRTQRVMWSRGVGRGGGSRGMSVDWLYAVPPQPAASFLRPLRKVLQAFILLQGKNQRTPVKRLKKNAWEEFHCCDISDPTSG